MGWGKPFPDDLESSADSDADSVIDICDLCPAGDDFSDTDNDFTPDAGDLSPYIYDYEQLDTDNDKLGNECDNCVQVANPNQNDRDGDALGDACDPDIDGDGVPNESDICPGTISGLFVDTEGCPSPAIPSDFDQDGDVDGLDFDHFEACASGPTVPQMSPSCSDALLDGDDDVDQIDFAIWQRCYSGEDRPADPNCQ